MRQKNIAVYHTVVSKNCIEKQTLSRRRRLNAQG